MSSAYDEVLDENLPMTGKVISNKTYEFLRFQYQDAVQNFLDDPDGIFNTAKGVDLPGMVEYYKDLVLIGKDCGHDFWTLAAKVGTQYEIDRLMVFLNLKETAVNA